MVNYERKQKDGFWCIFRCFLRHGELVSLLFMGRVESNFEKYKQLLHSKALELSDAINAVGDVLPTTSGSSRINSRTKLHMLHHLLDDLNRFGAAIHFETEKGEQFNKFIRERIYHTNRRSPSRDLLLCLGKEFMFRHIVDGATWVKDDERMQAGTGILNYLRDHPQFREVFLRSDPEYANNNELPKVIIKGVARLFLDARSNTLFFGGVAQIDKLRVRLDKYEPKFVAYPALEKGGLPLVTTAFSGTPYTQIAERTMLATRSSRELTP